MAKQIIIHQAWQVGKSHGTRTNKIKGQKGEEGGVGSVRVIGARISMQRRRRSTHACCYTMTMPGPLGALAGYCMARSTGTCVCAFDHSGSTVALSNWTESSKTRQKAKCRLDMHD